ncbi:MAG TPA: hypothetical protein DCP72_01130 [Ruminococcaceae bacterium]|jgi:hypothetical protein|nr:hypothetical protein [Oscillospiraceae bacterium]
MKKGGRTMKKSKILVSTALALCMGATAVTPAFAADNESFTFTKIGDYNADGVASVSDITALQLQLGGNGTISGTALEHIDFNGDGAFNVNDITELQKMVAGTEYTCYQKTDSSYKNIPMRYYVYDYNGNSKGDIIEYETIDTPENYIMTVDEMRRNSVKGISLITSKEQFVDLFKAESPEFDDEFFKDNALFVMLTARDWYDYTGINSFALDGNKLIVYDYEVETFMEYGEKCCRNNIYRLNKADIENITEINFYTQYLAQ